MRVLEAKYKSRSTCIYNHPMLKFYLEKQACEKKAELDRETLKRRAFQTVKWAQLKKIKEMMIEEHQHKLVAAKLVQRLLARRVADQYLREVATRFHTRLAEHQYYM